MLLEASPGEEVDEVDDPVDRSIGALLLTSTTQLELTAVDEDGETTRHTFALDGERAVELRVVDSSLHYASAPIDDLLDSIAAALDGDGDASTVELPAASWLALITLDRRGGRPPGRFGDRELQEMARALVPLAPSVGQQWLEPLLVRTTADDLAFDPSIERLLAAFKARPLARVQVRELDDALLAATPTPAIWLCGDRSDRMLITPALGPDGPAFQFRNTATGELRVVLEAIVRAHQPGAADPDDPPVETLAVLEGGQPLVAAIAVAIGSEALLGTAKPGLTDNDTLLAAVDHGMRELRELDLASFADDKLIASNGLLRVIEDTFRDRTQLVAWDAGASRGVCFCDEGTIVDIAVRGDVGRIEIASGATPADESARRVDDLLFGELEDGRNPVRTVRIERGPDAEHGGLVAAAWRWHDGVWTDVESPDTDEGSQPTPHPDVLSLFAR